MLETPKETSLREASSALQLSPVFALRSLRVEQLDGNLLLSGTVSSFYYKQLAQEVVRSVSDGLGVTNLIQVVDRNGRNSQRRAAKPESANAVMSPGS